MKTKETLQILAIALFVATSCKKWVDTKDVSPADEPTNPDSGQGVQGLKDGGNPQADTNGAGSPSGTPVDGEGGGGGDGRTPTSPGGNGPSENDNIPDPSEVDPGPQVGEGKVWVKAHLVKTETQSWFQNCLTFQISGDKSGSVDAGCNKNGVPGEPGKENRRFLQEENEEIFSVSQNETVKLTLNFETWRKRRESDCITYSQCEDPYLDPAEISNLGTSQETFRCYKANGNTFQIYYEDQPESSFAKDRAVRSMLWLEDRQQSPAVANPIDTDWEARYRFQPGQSLDPNNNDHKCLLAKNSDPNFVTEKSLQSCFGVDFRDFVIQVKTQDSRVELGDLTNVCQEYSK